jgi:hypothetical protein
VADAMHRHGRNVKLAFIVTVARQIADEEREPAGPIAPGPYRVQLSFMPQRSR